MKIFKVLVMALTVVTTQACSNDEENKAAEAAQVEKERLEVILPKKDLSKYENGMYSE